LNATPAGNISTPPAPLGTNIPIKNINDLPGMRLDL
ncbi:MAG: hypothetical protein CEN88_355, partial [Candidatus Berkelbacteria bacterium Licking1014_2]